MAERPWNKIAGRRRQQFANWAIGLSLALFSVWTLAPILWLVVSSLMEQQALTATPPDFSAGSFTLQNYAAVMSAAAALGHGLLNSLIVAVASTAVAPVVLLAVIFRRSIMQGFSEGMIKG